MRFRLLALDIDGTLLDSARQIRPRVRAALAAALDLGVRVVLATGRRGPAARRVRRELDLGALPLILHNGALVLVAERVLRCLPLARATALEAIRAGRRMGAGALVHCGQAGEGRLLFEHGAPQSALVAYYLGRANPDLQFVPHLEQALAEDPMQVMFGGPLQELSALEPALAGALGTSVHLEKTVYPERDVALIDVLAPGVGKASAIRFLRDLWGVQREETLAIGDNWNDREMLLEAGVGLVMGNAEPGMRALGLGGLPSNDEDGVAVAVERHILGSAPSDHKPR